MNQCRSRPLLPFLPEIGRLRRAGARRGLRLAAHFRMPVHRHISDIAQQLGRPVLAPLQIEEFRRVVDEPRRVIPGAEIRMFQHRFQKGEVGRHAAYTVFPQRPVHPRDRLFRVRRPGGHLLQQRVVKPRADSITTSRAKKPLPLRSYPTERYVFELALLFDSSKVLIMHYVKGGVLRG